MGVSFLPALVCGPASGYGWHIGVDPDASAAEQGEIRRQLVDAMEAEADRRGLAPVLRPYVLETETELRALLVNGGATWERRNVPVAVMEVAWDSMDEYFAHLAAASTAGNSGASGGGMSKAASLVEVPRLLRRAGGSVSRIAATPTRAATAPTAWSFGQDLLAELRANMGADAVVFVARKDAAISGVHAGVRQDAALAAFAVGVDQELSGDDLTYFQILGYYSLIEYAIEHGIRRIDYGRGMVSDQAAARLPADGSVDLHARRRTRRLLNAPWYAFVSVWNRYKFPSSVRRNCRRPAEWMGPIRLCNLIWSRYQLCPA